MATVAFERWDAFVDGRAPGSAAAVVRLHAGEPVDAEAMARLARELKGFVDGVTAAAPQGDGVALRFFAPAGETGFSGAGTLAAANSLLADGSDAPPALLVGGTRLLLRHQDPRTHVQAPKVAVLALPAHLDDLYWALGVSEPLRGEEEEAAFLDIGVRVLLIPVRTSEALSDLVPVWEAMTNYCERARVDIVAPYTDNPTLSASRWRLRAFAPRLGLREVASGAGSAALGARMLALGRWHGEDAQAELGASFERPSLVQLFAEPQDGQLRVWFGGPAALRFSGTYYL